MLRRLSWSAMTLLALGVGAYAVASLFSEALRTPFVQNLFTLRPLAIGAHLGGGTVALVLGAFQVNSKLRHRRLPMHRWFGRVYVAAVLAAGIAGLVLAVSSSGGLAANFGFGMMAVLWLTTTALAFWYIRNGNVAEHRAWMLRSYALTLAAVTLRVYLPLSQIYGIDFIAAYQAIAWLCWVPNLVIVDWFVLKRAR